MAANIVLKFPTAYTKAWWRQDYSSVKGEDGWRYSSMHLGFGKWNYKEKHNARNYLRRDLRWDEDFRAHRKAYDKQFIAIMYDEEAIL
jgi:hypothetical protein